MKTTGERSLRPVFIVGVHRSGTTLLRYMLSSSPRMYIPPESDFIPRFFAQDPHERLSQERVAHLLNVIFTSYRFAKEWQDDPPDPEEFFEKMHEPAPWAFLDILYSTYATQYDAVRWGDKTPIYTSYLPLIHQLFPNAQFLHVIRDGRDVALSTVDKWGANELHVDVYYAACIWMRRIRQARSASKTLKPELYREVRYEDLVQNPPRELQVICDFLGEPFFPQMAMQHEYARGRIPPEGFHAPVREPPDATRVARWQREMSVSDQRLYQQVAGWLLDDLGYPLVDIGHMSLRERVRLLALRGKYEALQSGRRLLQRLGLVPPIYGPAPSGD